MGRGRARLLPWGRLINTRCCKLLMDGPREHFISVVRVGCAGSGPVIDASLAELTGSWFMAGRAVGDIVSAQSHAVPEALARAGRPVRTIDIPKLDARAMGALVMHFMLETIFVGRLLQIDPFDQPAVELAKQLTRERLESTRG